MKFRALVVAMMAGGLLAGCALQDVGARFIAAQVQQVSEQRALSA